jgi:O-antigen ligase
MFERGKIPLSFLVLGIATAAVFYPVEILLGVGIIGFLTLCYCFPLFGIAAVIAATLPGEFGRIEILGNSMLLLDVISPFVVLIWGIRKIIRKEKFVLNNVNTSLLVFFGIAILSFLFGSSWLNAGEIKFSFLYLVRFLMLGSLFFVAADLGKSQEKILHWLFIAGGILAVVGFYLLRVIPDFTAAGLAELGWDPHIGRLTSTWLDPNFAAGGFAFLLALLGGKFLQVKKLKQQAGLLILAGVLLIALLLTYSRSGLLALGVSGLILGLVGNRKLLLVMMVVGVLGITASPRLQERVGELAQSATSLIGESQQVLDATAQLRVDSWEEGLRIWKENPILGVGFGSYKFHQNFSSENSHAASGSDASMLNVAATTGVLGLIAFLIFLGNLFVECWKQRKTALGIGLLAGLSGLLIHAIFVNSLFFPAILVWIMVSGGLLIGKK